MRLDADLLGFFAAMCTTCSFIPQVLLVWRQRSGAGVSTGMYLLFSLGVSLWLGFGVALGSWPVIIANAITLTLSLSVLWMKWHFARTVA